MLAYEKFRSFPDVNHLDLVLVGEGSETESLKNYVSSNNIPGIFFYPFCPPERVSHYYANAGIFILPSFYGETWGNVVVEAMASSLPVIVSENCGCAQSVVSEGINGWKFNPNNINELANKLKFFSLLDENKKLEMGRNSNILSQKWSTEYLSLNVKSAIDKCKNEKVGYYGFVDFLVLQMWRGRFRLAE